MDVKESYNNFAAAESKEEEMMDIIKKGPWTKEEDSKLFDYITIHGEGRWNSIACSAGLNRTGKSCRLRWLNYLHPDVRHGNITLEEQLLILQLHFRWGNRWSQIAQHLPGRTDNFIKNYWRTRVKNHANQLKCDVNSKQFRDVMLYVWLPRLEERVRPSYEASKRPSIIGTSSPIDHSTAVIPPEGQIHQTGLEPIDEDYLKSQMFGTALEQFKAQVSPLSVVTDWVDDVFSENISWLNDLKDGPFYSPEWSGSTWDCSHECDIEALEHGIDWFG